MRVIDTLLTASLACLTIVEALPHANISVRSLIPGAKRGAGAVSLGIRHRKGHRGLSSRQESQAIYNEASFYEVQSKFVEGHLSGY
jgi:hypothetical protein